MLRQKGSTYGTAALFLAIFFVAGFALSTSLVSALTPAEYQAYIDEINAAAKKQKTLPAPKTTTPTPTVSKPSTQASKTTTTPSIRTLSRGMRGVDVTALQKALISQGLLSSDSATGFFGALTEAAVKKFQTTNEIVSSGSPATTGYGLVGPKTRTVLAYAKAIVPAPLPASSSAGMVFTRTLDVGATGADVTALQILLKDRGFLSAEPTGYFGPATRAAVIAYQRANALPQVGSVDPKTREVLNTRSTTPPAPTPTPTPRPTSSPTPPGGGGGGGDTRPTPTPVPNTLPPPQTPSPSSLPSTAAPILAASSVVTSIRNLTWARTTRPVFDMGGAGKWDQQSIYNPRIAKYSDGITPYVDAIGDYYMYYTASDGNNNTDYDATGLAKSNDLVNWRKISTDAPILPRTTGGLDAGDNSAVSIIYDGGQFHMWYEGNATPPGVTTGDSVTINYATSQDGITWTKYAGNPVLNKGTGGDKDDLYAPVVIKDGSTWKMWYTGHSYSPGADTFAVMHATAPSPQGPWTRYSSSYILSPRFPVFPASVWKENGMYQILYSGNPMPLYANSIDGISWTNITEFLPRGSMAWDNGLIGWPSIFLKNGVYHIFYYGNAYSSTYSLGAASGIGYITTASSAPVPTSKLVIHNPLTTYPVQTGRTVNVSGACDPMRGSVMISVGANSATATCTSNNTFSTNVNYTGGGGGVTVSARYSSSQIVEYSYVLDVHLNVTPFTVTSPASGATLSSKNVTISGTCDASQGTIVLAVGSDTTTTTCTTSGTFSRDITFTGASGNISIGGKYTASPNYIVNISVLISLTTTLSSVPLSLTSISDSQTLTSRGVAFAGGCDSTQGDIFAAISYDTAVLPCVNDSYSGTVMFTGSSGNQSVGVRYTSSPSYLINVGVLMQVN